MNPCRISAWHRAKSSRQPVHLICTSAFACGRTVHLICSHRRVYIVRALAKREMTGRFLRGNVLDDFCYFWSYKSRGRYKVIISAMTICNARQRACIIFFGKENNACSYFTYVKKAPCFLCKLTKFSVVFKKR